VQQVSIGILTYRIANQRTREKDPHHQVENGAPEEEWPVQPDALESHHQVLQRW